MQNTYKHISDKSLFVTFDPTGSGFPESVTNVQDALSKIGPWALSDNGLPKASETVEGIIRLSTQKEVDDGISDNTAVTPKTLAERLNHPEASETVLGLTQYATNTEALSGLLTNRSIVASSLDYVLNTRTSTESKTGTIKISTGLQAEAGEDDTTAMTPKKVKQAINKLSPSIGIATETNTGTVTLATAGIAQAGTAHDGVAISPKIFVSARATDTKVGTTKIANTTEAKDKSNNTVVLSPKALQEIKGSNTEFGLIKLSETISNDANTALSSKAQVVFKNFTVNGKPLQGNGITLTASDLNTWTKQEADARYMRSDSASMGVFFDVWTINKDYYRTYWRDFREIGRSTCPGKFRNLQFNLNITNSSDLRPLQMKIFKNGQQIHFYEYFAKYMNYAPIMPRIMIPGTYNSGDVISAQINCNSGNNMIMNITTCELIYS